MATLLLIIIYITFIGLGIPDSIFGTAWPAIYREFHLPVSYAGFVTGIISGGTILSSLLSAKLIRRFGTAKITAFSTALTAGALLGFSQACHIVTLCLSAIPLGLGAGAIDTALNHYVAIHYRSVHMNFLHCFYGIGVSLSPYLMSRTLSKQTGWQGGYRAIFCIQLGITVISVLTIPLWAKAHPATPNKETDASVQSLAGLLRDPAVCRVCLAFLGSCAIEYTCGIWGSTFLVNGKGLDPAHAAKIITLYYAGLAIGRFLSGVLAFKYHSRRIIRYGQGVLAAAILLLLPPSPVSGCALFLAGLGNAPVFPNMIHLTPENFGPEKSQAVIGIEMSVSYCSILLAPVLFGWIAQYVSILLFPYYLCILFLIMMYGMKQPRHTRSHKPS